MGITIDNSIRLIEDYHKWKKQFGLDGSGVDDATNKLLEVAKKYQKIQEIYSDYLKYMNPDNLADRIGEVLEDGSENNHHASNT